MLNGKCPPFNTWCEYDAWMKGRAQFRDASFYAEHERIAREGMSGFYAGSDEMEIKVAPVWWGRRTTKV